MLKRITHGRKHDFNEMYLPYFCFQKMGAQSAEPIVVSLFLNNPPTLLLYLTIRS